MIRKEPKPVLSSLSFNLDTDLLKAVMPLLEGEEVEAVEWTFDSLYQRKSVPVWFTDLVQAFAQAGRLLGHGIFYSLFSGKWMPEHAKWLDELRAINQQYQFAHITEHFGFMTGGDFHKGAPMAVPMTPETLALGQDRLQRLAQASGCPVGLENLAFAWSQEEAEKHGYFLEALLEPVNGFLILDLHNLYCQVVNFGLDPDEAIKGYPLERVREIHVSGGSWADSTEVPGRKIRRDTHDAAVPQAVFDLLEMVLPQCPNLQFVVMEQIGIALKTEEAREQFREDFRQMALLVKSFNQANPDHRPDPFLPLTSLSLSDSPLESPSIHHQQKQLSSILESAPDHSGALKEFRKTQLSDHGWEYESWPPHMLETAIRISQKWKGGFKTFLDREAKKGKAGNQ